MLVVPAAVIVRLIVPVIGLVVGVEVASVYIAWPCVLAVHICSKHLSHVFLWLLILVGSDLRICCDVSCLECCCSGPFALLSSIAIWTASGSSVLLSGS